MQNSVIEIILQEENAVNDGVHERVMKDVEYKAASDKGFEEYKKLEQCLSEEQKKLLWTFIDLYSDEKVIACEKYFKEGFKAGLRLAVECFTEYL